MSPPPIQLRAKAPIDESDPRGRLARTLEERGWARKQDLDAAHALAGVHDDDLGDVLVAHGWAQPDNVAAARADLWRMGYANINRNPPDPKAARPEDLSLYLKYRIIPWRRFGKLTAYVTSDPHTVRKALAELEPDIGMAICLVADAGAVDRALIQRFGPELAERAAQRTPRDFSVRSLGLGRYALLSVIIALAAGFVAAPGHGLAALGFLLLVLSLATTGVRLAALLCSRRSHPWFDTPKGIVTLADRRPPPKISVLVPLYKEAEMIPPLVRSLERLDYPRERLDVIILLEADDKMTIAAAESAALPPWMRVIVVPDGGPKTKPRALNFALDFCDGEVIGVLDAEDHPEPDQLRKIADHFRAAPLDIACLQCQLAFFNARENWITRCFQIEYAIWFDVLLRGWQRLALPLPLGGTSVYFRASALRSAGAWDAHNVTEDADLGMRLARLGLRTEVVSSTTHEEANCRMLPWIRQRSRWLKGYMMTWLNHMRRPHRLWQDLGPAGFFGFQVLFIGGAASYLAMPLFWVALACTLFLGERVYGAVFPDWAFITLGICLVAGQAVMLSAATLALVRRKAVGLGLWIPTLPLYWTIGAVAAWKAVVELGSAPYYWDKTRHGISSVSAPSDQT